MNDAFSVKTRLNRVESGTAYNGLVNKIDRVKTRLNRVESGTVYGGAEIVGSR